MNQIEALENALEALHSYSEGGNDDAGEAADVIGEMLSALTRKRERARRRRNWDKLGKILETVPAEFRRSKP